MRGLAGILGLILVIGLLGVSKPAGAATLLIENVTIIDGTGRPAVENAHVLIDGEVIRRVGRGSYKGPKADQTLDGAGKYLIPGLMDAHVHIRGAANFFADNNEKKEPDWELAGRVLHGYLYAGVTTVYDANNLPGFIYTLRRQERAGEITAPRIFATGSAVTVPGGHGAFPGSTQIESWPAGRAALAKHLEASPDLVKLTYDEHNWGTRPLIPTFTPELLEEVIKYLNENGLRTTIHTSNEIRAREAIYAGVDTLAHPVIQSPVSAGFVRLMAAKKVPMVSTLTIGDGYSRLIERPEYLDGPLYQAIFTKKEIARLKGEVRDAFIKRPWSTWMKVMTPVAQENLRLINAAGGIIALGSDQSNGPATHRELELLVEAGVPALEAIRIGTLNVAIFLGRERDMGSVEEGKLADLVLLNSDPLADINNAKDIHTVIKGGSIIDRSALDLPVNGR
ncbi:MAG: amidohydrolase family protein [Sphingomonadales bacterium]